MKNKQQLSEFYNALPAVELSDDKLNLLGKQKVLNTLCEVIANYGLEEVVGIRLLHNHNIISEDEQMFESAEMDEIGAPCLVTSAQKRTAVGNSTANSWMWRNDDFLPVEFSADEEVVKNENILLDKSGFFNEFANALKELKVADILGPCVIPRSFYKNHKPPFASMLAETSDTERRANILKYEPQIKYDGLALIDTTWRAYKGYNEVTAGCTVACISISACVRQSDGTHKRETRHNRGSHVHTEVATASKN